MRFTKRQEAMNPTTESKLDRKYSANLSGTQMVYSFRALQANFMIRKRGENLKGLHF